MWNPDRVENWKGFLKKNTQYSTLVLSALALLLSIYAVSRSPIQVPVVATGEKKSVIVPRAQDIDTLAAEVELLRQSLSQTVNSILSLDVENLATEIVLNVTKGGMLVEAKDIYGSNCFNESGWSICSIQFEKAIVQHDIMWNPAMPEYIKPNKNCSYTIGAVCESVDIDPYLLVGIYKIGVTPCVGVSSQPKPLSPTGEEHMGRFYYTDTELELASDEYLVLCSLANSTTQHYDHCEFGISKFCTSSRCLPEGSYVLQTQ